MNIMNAVKDIVIKALPGRGYQTTLSQDVCDILKAPAHHALKLMDVEDLEFFLDICRGHGLSFRFSR